VLVSYTREYLLAEYKKGVIFITPSTMYVQLNINYDAWTLRGAETYKPKAFVEPNYKILLRMLLFRLHSLDWR